MRSLVVKFWKTFARVWNSKPQTNRLRKEYTTRGIHCIEIMKKRFRKMCIIVASAGVGGEGAGHHMCEKMLTEKDVETMQEAAMNMKKYLRKRGVKRGINECKKGYK